MALIPIKTNQAAHGLQLDKNHNIINESYAILFKKKFNQWNKEDVEIINEKEPVEYLLSQKIGKCLTQEEYDNYAKLVILRRENSKINLENKDKSQSEKKESQKKDKFIEPIQKSFFNLKGKLYQQVSGNQFICRTESGFENVGSITDGENTYIPCFGDELELNGETVILPEFILDYETVPKLIEEIKAHIHKYIDVSAQYENFAAWYVLLTWVYDQVPTINYLSVMGDTGTGKSRFFDVVGGICYMPILGSGAVSVAALKRLCHKWKGTLCIDEGDFKESDESVEIIKFFNLGFEKNRRMFNCNKNDPSKLEFFDPYCPKIITRRKQFTDQALEARCLTEVMQQTNRKDIPALLIDSYRIEKYKLINKLLKFRFDYYDKINVSASIDVDMGDIEPRIKQATMAFITLLANIPDALETFKVFLKDYNKQLIEERGNSFDGQIINTIADLMQEGHIEISPGDIELRLLSQGTKANNKVVGKHLNQLKIKTKPSKINGKTKRLIIFDEQFTNVCKRYLPDFSGFMVSTVSKHIVDVCHETETQKTATQKTLIKNHTSYDTDETDEMMKPINEEYSITGRCIVCNGWVKIRPDILKCQDCDISAEEEQVQ